MSRQRKWQIKQQERGNCMICGKPVVTKHRCRFHADEDNKRMKDKRKASKKYE